MNRLKWLETITKVDWVFTLFCLFLATDIGFIILHLIHSYTALLPNAVFSLETDRGYSEILQYIKEYWSALILISLGVRSRKSIYIVWALLFFYLLLDDAAEIHERLGFFLSNALSLPALISLRAQDFGELAVFTTVGLFFLVAMIVAYRSSDRLSRQVTKSLLLLLVALIFFGLVIDLIHIAFYNPTFNPLFAVLEDGGELVVMSGIVCFILSLSLKQKEATILQPLLNTNSP